MGRRGGGKFSKPPVKPRTRPGEEEEEVQEADDEPQYKQSNRGLGGQASTVGCLPPSDSEEDEEEKPTPKPKPKEQPKQQSKTAGALPPNSSDEDESSDEESSDDEPAGNDYLTAPRTAKAPPAAEVRSAEQIRKDLERLTLIKKRREDDRLDRIAKEGWDRYAPVADGNRPPGSVSTEAADRK
mmetsp:Transcript_35/g.62  ORF Transcript_35/g.62 Transcript_35/m.62 type:complete len:184 (-) Transcript_35:878-1429(-)|eukprot:CAMPEP_0119101868 /NCGR_PEP_ID=MMETSP1180-20130426/792_1 /TAXON_ID=3052 ORGANISM="Chlamydomonas cf sp, Strain CCMP681" /NCGR_SAMPLE_ID=MMETSP1180 /ASSEMBLY_ACC=CAM_ASM_000741 /LENGTH=183 /DNA_ID=CAMNT_0007086049 /DNA_START=78 /DNA_END=629 /DNA_ORIENTATION=+